LCYCHSIKGDAQSATHTVAVSSVAGLVKLDAVIATQVIYTASSVAERIVGLFKFISGIPSPDFSCIPSTPWRKQFDQRLKWGQ
jgi:hypothetical protein